MKNLIEFIKKMLIMGKDDKIVSPISTTQPPTPTPTPDYVKGIVGGLTEYLGKTPPVATLAADFVEEAKKNKLNPYLLPAISVIETGGGSRETIPNNPLNWGIKTDITHFFPKSPQETISKAASGIGTGRAFPQYDKYRETGEIEDLAKHYAPPSENDTQNWINVVKDVMSKMKKYERPKTNLSKM